MSRGALEHARSRARRPAAAGSPSRARRSRCRRSRCGGGSREPPESWQQQLDDPVGELLDRHVGVLPHPVGHALVGGVDGVGGQPRARAGRRPRRPSRPSARAPAPPGAAHRARLLREAAAHRHQRPRRRGCRRRSAGRRARRRAGAPPARSRRARRPRSRRASRSTERSTQARNRPVLAAEQLVHDRLGHPRAAGQLVHRGARVAALGEQLLGELEQLPLAHGARHAAVGEVLDAMAARPTAHVTAGRLLRVGS